jgi:hypothetical protein
MSATEHDPLMYEVRLEDVIEQLEVNGVDVDQLPEAEIERLRDIFESDAEVLWQRFVAVATAAERFSGKPPLPEPEPVRGPDGTLWPF